MNVVIFLFFLILLTTILFIFRKQKLYKEYLTRENYTGLKSKRIKTEKLIADISGNNGNSNNDKGVKERTAVVESNLELIKKSNIEQQALQQKLGPNFKVATFAGNKFLPFTYEQFIINFTGLNIPENLLTTSAKFIANGNYQLVDFERIPGTEDRKDIFYGLSPKLFNKARDQGTCGSCWSFAAVACVEAQIVKKFLSESPPFVSVQYYLDCVKRARGCEGGFPIYVYQRMAMDGFVPWEDNVPYLGETITCTVPFKKFPINFKGVIMGSKTNFAYFDSRNLAEAEKYENLELIVPDVSMIQKIKKLLFNYGPLGLLIYVDQKLPFFQNGIYIALNTNKDGVKQWPNHAVVIAGYGMNVYGQDYWIVRNSWGSEWAEDGYIPLSTKSYISGLNIPILDQVPPLVEGSAEENT
jgi:hypothetical protein